MTIRGISLEQAEKAAAELGIEFIGSDTSGPRKGVEASGVLRPVHGSNPYQRISASPLHHQRKVAAICWHGHRDFMRRVFDLNPDARIVSMLADYHGKDAFERNFPATGYRNVGSPMYPVSMCSVCTCPEAGSAR